MEGVLVPEHLQSTVQVPFKQVSNTTNAHIGSWNELGIHPGGNCFDPLWTLPMIPPKGRSGEEDKTHRMKWLLGEVLTAVSVTAFWINVWIHNGIMEFILIQEFLGTEPGTWKWHKKFSKNLQFPTISFQTLTKKCIISCSVGIKLPKKISATMIQRKIHLHLKSSLPKSAVAASRCKTGSYLDKKKKSCQAESNHKKVAAPTPENSHKGRTGVAQAYKEQYTIPTVKNRGESGQLWATAAGKQHVQEISSGQKLCTGRTWTSQDEWEIWVAITVSLTSIWLSHFRIS